MTSQEEVDGRSGYPTPPPAGRFRTPRARQQVTDCLVALTALLLISVVLYSTAQYNGW